MFAVAAAFFVNFDVRAHTEARGYNVLNVALVTDAFLFCAYPA